MYVSKINCEIVRYHLALDQASLSKSVLVVVQMLIHDWSEQLGEHFVTKPEGRIFNHYFAESQNLMHGELNPQIVVPDVSFTHIDDYIPNLWV